MIASGRGGRNGSSGPRVNRFTIPHIYGGLKPGGVIWITRIGRGTIRRVHALSMRREVNPVQAPSILACSIMGAVLLGGCDATPDWGWKRTDGQSAREDPALMRQFQTDRSACLGAPHQAGIVGATAEQGSPSGTMRSMRDNQAMDVIQECMARKGYVRVPRREMDDGLAER